ncbi:GLE1-domain-containing protein [Poronia punctata]|nr:GLE1-domain-containing protein [Poronia punctata]
MTGSSPASRRSRQWSSPSRGRLSDFLSEPRHTELSHQDALAAAQIEHERVRLAAIRVYKDHELKEEHRRLLEKEQIIRQQQRKEEERIRNEERLRAEEERLRALKAKTVPKLPPQPPPEAPAAPITATTTAPASTSAAQLNGVQPFPTDKEPITPASNVSQPDSTKAPSLETNGVKVAKPASNQSPDSTKPSPFSVPSAAAIQAKATALIQQNARAQNQTSASKPPDDGYIVIHQNLKKLRAYMAEQAKSSPALKTRMGDMRREMRKSLGQFVMEKGGNKQQIAAIQRLFQESLSGSVPSAPVDPSQFILDRQRAPVEGALHNEAQLPSLFIYLLNIFSKSIINQFINECAMQPRAADPLGVIAAQTFSNKSHLWRGESLIDILMAKFRVVCPVLFGYRGSEKTEQGRLRIGWRKDGGAWTAENHHIDRMKGLGAGYAAIALRDFSRSSNKNPWPPSKYWTSMARIVNTPPAEMSNTQCIVLRSMIETYEERFFLFYGTAAIAALRKALIDFPRSAPVKTSGTSGLEVLAQMLKRDIGLEL